jgi:hypothetical protein
LNHNVSISLDIRIRRNGELIFELRISEDRGKSWLFAVGHSVTVLNFLLRCRTSHGMLLKNMTIKYLICIEDMILKKIFFDE